MRVGILTGGGDCPGLNAVLRAVVRKGERFHGDEIIGFKDAWDGVREGRTMPLTIDVMRGVAAPRRHGAGDQTGQPVRPPDGVDEIKRTFNDLGIDALIVVGGNGSLTVAHSLAEEEGLPIVGVPKTIDNDVVGTDLTFGFHTAVQIATEAIDRLHTTAESHDRVMVVEVMGRHSGWIAAYAGIAGGASVVLIPEIPFDIEKVCVHLRQAPREGSLRVDRRGRRGRRADPGDDPGRRAGVRQVRPRPPRRHRRRDRPRGRASEPGSRRGSSCSATSSGGAPRPRSIGCSRPASGSPPSTSSTSGWGQMVALRGTEIVACPLADTVGRTKPLDMSLYHGVAEVFFS